ncbi:MAG: hypothetical protein ABIH42_07505 [Planctomycetota bacterium]
MRVQDTETKTDFITVHPPPTVTVSVDNRYLPRTYFTVTQYNDGVTSWGWDIDNNGLINVITTTPTTYFTFTPGWHMITVIVTGTYGRTAESVSFIVPPN